MSDFRERASAARDVRSYPGLLASPADIQQAQTAASRWAAGQDDPARAIADEREQRYRVLLRSVLWWVLVGIPVLGVLLQLLIGWIVDLAFGVGRMP